jgi:antirestriction protein ArdC
MKAESRDIYQRVTDQVVEAIEAGAESFKMPWRTSGGFPASPINAVSKRPYRGINVVILWAIAQARGYQSGTWATFKQWQQLGAQVRKGETSAHVVFWKFLDKESADSDDGEGKQKGRIPMAKDYWIFNADQVDGYRQIQEPPLSKAERIEHADEFFRMLGVDLRVSANLAYYAPITDSVHMPAFEVFKESLFYYSVLSHESTHWTGAPHRLNRDLKGRFGSDAYAVEELIAELGAAFLCAELGLPTDPRRDHAPYIATWLKVLKNDKKAIFTAAAKAQEAVDWMKAACQQGEKAA